MFFDDNKKAVSVIRGRLDQAGNRVAMRSPMKPEIIKTENGEPDGRHEAMQDFMNAHHEGSAEKMSQAMQNFITIHHAVEKTPVEPADVEDAEMRTED